MILRRIKLLLEIVSSCVSGTGTILLLGGAFYHSFHSVHLSRRKGPGLDKVRTTDSSRAVSSPDLVLPPTVSV